MVRGYVVGLMLVCCVRGEVEKRMSFKRKKGGQTNGRVRMLGPCYSR